MEQAIAMAIKIIFPDLKTLDKILTEQGKKGEVTLKGAGAHGTKIYELKTPEGDMEEFSVYLCMKCGYVLGEPYLKPAPPGRRYNIHRTGPLSTNIGNGYYCTNCDTLVHEEISIQG